MEGILQNYEATVTETDQDFETFGEYLRQARLARQVSLEEMSWATKIKMDFLQALELCDIDCLPEDIFVKGYIKSYAKYLEMNPEEPLRMYQVWKGQNCVEKKELVIRRERTSLFSRILSFLDSIKRLLTGREDYQVY